MFVCTCKPGHGKPGHKTNVIVLLLNQDTECKIVYYIILYTNMPILNKHTFITRQVKCMLNCGAMVSFSYKDGANKLVKVGLYN